LEEEPFVAAGEVSGSSETEKHAVKSSNILVLQTEGDVAISVGGEEGKQYVAAREVTNCWLTKRHVKESLLLVIKIEEDVNRSASTEAEKLFVGVREASSSRLTKNHVKKHAESLVQGI